MQLEGEASGVLQVCKDQFAAVVAAGKEALGCNRRKSLPSEAEIQAKVREIAGQLNSVARSTSTQLSSEGDLIESSKKVPFVGPDARGFENLIPVELKKQLALDPNSYIDLPRRYQTDENIALFCIQNGVRAVDVVMCIMTWCPSLQSHPMAWRMLINSALEPKVFELADRAITSDAQLMIRAIRCCGSPVYPFLQPNLRRDIAIKTLALKGMLRPEFHMYFCRENRSSSTLRLLKYILDESARDQCVVWKLAVEIIADPAIYYEDLDDFWQRAAPSILDDKEIMKAACLSIGGDQIQFASERLRRNVELLREIIFKQRIRENDFLLHVPDDVFLEHPSLVVEFLEQDGNTGTVLDALPTQLWKNRSIAKMYLRRGGHPHKEMEEGAGEDWDYCLAFVEGSANRRGQPLTDWIDERLRMNVSFLIEAAKRSKWVLRCADSRPFELILVTAVYHGVQPLRAIQISPQENSESTNNAPFDLLAFAAQVRAELQDKDNFLVVMCGIGIERPGGRSLLTMLNPDIAEQVARFVGVPYGERLMQLQRARPICNELYRDPEGREFLAHVEREHHQETVYNVL